MKENESVDRLHRFRSSTGEKQKTLNISEFISTDDWALFDTLPYVCHILNFKNLYKKTKKESTIKRKSIELSEKKQRNYRSNVYIF